MPVVDVIDERVSVEYFEWYTKPNPYSTVLETTLNPVDNCGLSKYERCSLG